MKKSEIGNVSINNEVVTSIENLLQVKNLDNTGLPGEFQESCYYMLTELKLGFKISMDELIELMSFPYFEPHVEQFGTIIHLSCGDYLGDKWRYILDDFRISSETFHGISSENRIVKNESYIKELHLLYDKRYMNEGPFYGFYNSRTADDSDYDSMVVLFKTKEVYDIFIRFLENYISINPELIW